MQHDNIYLKHNNADDMLIDIITKTFQHNFVE